MTQKKTKINKIELYFEWYIQELKDYGYIKEWYREPETLTVAEKATAHKFKTVRNKKKMVEIPLFPKIRLTYDYLIIWQKTAEYFFYEVIEPHNVLFQLDRPLFIAHNGPLEINSSMYPKELDYSYIDVKTLSMITKFGSNSSSYTFPLKQRMLYDCLGIYVNKIIPIPTGKRGLKQSLFVNSFIPTRYTLTDGGKMQRKINFPGMPLNTFLNKKQKVITSFFKNK